MTELEIALIILKIDHSKGAENLAGISPAEVGKRDNFRAT